jgi:hypothetical protein
LTPAGTGSTSDPGALPGLDAASIDEQQITEALRGCPGVHPDLEPGRLGEDGNGGAVVRFTAGRKLRGGVARYIPGRGEYVIAIGIRLLESDGSSGVLSRKVMHIGPGGSACCAGPAGIRELTAGLIRTVQARYGDT